MADQEKVEVTSTAEAAICINESRRCRDMADEHNIDSFSSGVDELEQAAEAYLTVVDVPLVGTGGEFHVDRPQDPGLQPRLNRPSRVTLNASDERLSLLIDTDTVDLGLDLAEQIGATNSIERMIAHQMALAHRLAMRFGRRTEQQMWKQSSANSAANSVARLMKAFQEGAQTIAKLRNGNQQIVTVQHVTVGSGGQAMVAGSVGQSSEASRKGG